MLGNTDSYISLMLKKAVQARLVSPENSNCLQAIVEVISNVMDNNPYAKLCKNMRTVELEKEEKTSMENVQPREILMHFISGPDAKRFNYPTNSEIAVTVFLLVRMELLLSIVILLSIQLDNISIKYITSHKYK